MCACSTLGLACTKHFSVNNIADLCHHHHTHAHDVLLAHYYCCCHCSAVDHCHAVADVDVVHRHCHPVNWHHVNVNSIPAGFGHCHFGYCLRRFAHAQHEALAAVYFSPPMHVVHDGFAVAVNTK